MGIPPHLLIEIMKQNQKYPMDISSKEAKFLMVLWGVALLVILYLGVDMYLYNKERKEKNQAEQFERNTRYKANQKLRQVYIACLESRIKQREQGLTVEEPSPCVEPKMSY